MSLIVPIAFIALLVGAFAKQMTPRLWTLVGVVIVASVAWFSLHH